jgi:hypothetical protein
MLHEGIEEHAIAGVSADIQIQGAKDGSPNLNLALELEGLREALRQRKASPAEVAEHANDAGIWKVVQPYLQAVTANA